MTNEITLVIIGLYTAIYVIVFFIQKAQIDKTKEINASMKSFMDIFKIDEVKKYVDLKDERVKMQAEKMILDSDELKKVTKEIVDDKVDYLKDIYLGQMKDQQLEMMVAVHHFLRIIDPKDRRKFVLETLPTCERVFLPMIEDMEKEEANDEAESNQGTKN